MTANVYFAAGADLWPDYRTALQSSCARLGLDVVLADTAPDPGAGIVSLTPADPMELQALCATKGGQIATICLYPALVSPQIILTNPSPGAASCSQGKAVGGTVDCSGSGDRATSAYPGPKETNAFIGTCEGGPASVRAFCIAGELVSDTLSTYVHQVATSDETLAQCPDEKPVTIGGGCRSTNNKPVWQSRPVALGNDRWGWKCSGGKPDAYAVCAAITSQQQGS